MAVLFTVLCGFTLLMLGYFSYYFARGHFIEGTEIALNTEMKYIAAYPDLPERLPPDPHRIIARFGDDGSRPAAIPQDVSLMTEGIIVFDHPVSGKHFAGKIYTDDKGRKTLIGVDITEMTRNYHFMMVLSVIGIFMTAAVIIGSFTISIFVVRGTNDIAGTAREIMETGDLSRRIVVRWRWDDLSNMADTLNALFDRIEQLMQGVRNVSDNIAHDLRTPLARMRAPVDVLLKEFPDHPSVQALSAEMDRILQIFNALLRISRLEAEKRRSHFREVDLAEILQDVADFYEPLAEIKNIEIKTALARCAIAGDRDLLFQAFANIIDNAVKYTPEGGLIGVGLRKEDARAIVEIADNGPGVPPEETGRIFERFYRSDASRSTSGTGLGLSLSAAVADLHGGRIYAQVRTPGLAIITVF